MAIENQSRQAALTLLETLETVFSEINNAAQRPDMIKILKKDIRALIRSPDWSKGYHLMPAKHLGPRVGILESCTSHTECLRNIDSEELDPEVPSPAPA